MSMFDDEDQASPESVVNQDLSIAPRLVYTNSEANPEQGARALQLSAATGVSAPAIYGNIEPFEAQTKAAQRR